MTIEQLQKMHRTRPFQAFDIHVADGRVIPVQHPEMLAVPRPGRTIGVRFEDETITSLLLVTSLKPLADGRSRRRRTR